MSAILKISDGTNEIDLLQPGIGIGIAGNGWNPAIAPIIPTNQSSPFTDGQELSSYKFANATETFQHKVNADTQDGLIELVQDTRRLLIQGINYHVVDWQNSLVYLIAKASCETNTRYALVEMFQSPNDANPYQAPFLSQNKPQMDNMSVIIERGHWLSEIPGTGACQETDTIREWRYDATWTLVDNTSADFVWAFMKASNGDLYAGNDAGEILKSVDDGLNWASDFTIPATGTVRSLEVLSNGYFLAGTDVPNPAIYRSTDSGASWNSVQATVNEVADFIQLRNGDILAASNLVYRSTDNGATWANVFNPNTALSFIQTPSDAVIMGTLRDIYRSTDNGVTWSKVYTSVAFFYGFVQLDDGKLLGLQFSKFASTDPGGEASMVFSTDDGLTWGNDNTLPNTSGISIFQTDDNDLWVGADTGQIYSSISNGASWQLATDLGLFLVTGLIEADNGAIIAGTFGEIHKFGLDSTADMGSSNSCSVAHISNKENIANLTHIKIDDGGVFTDIFPLSGFSVDLLPAVPAVNDAIYFGIEQTVPNTGPFNSLAFDLDDTIDISNSYTITWEYWDGAAWATLIVTDGTGIGRSFTNPGRSVVVWEPPSDWATTTVDLIAALWVRARVSALAGSITPPSQQTDQIFSVNNVYFNVDAADIGGDIPSIVQHKIFNASDGGGKPVAKLTGTHTGANNQPTLTDAAATFNDETVLIGWYIFNDTDGSYGLITDITTTTIVATLVGGTDNDWDTNDAYTIKSGPDLWSNRVLAGLRSLSRGENFRSFINISDEQNVDGITVTAGTNATFGVDILAPTGRRLTYAAAIGDTSFVDRVTISFSSDIVRDYYGRFHLFLRGRQVSGSSGDITVRAQLITSSGGITYTTPEVIFSGTNDWELLDLDAITIPAGGRVIKPNEFGDIGTLSIQAKNNSGATRNVYFYDLILLPVDEWAGDFIDQANTDDSIIGRRAQIQQYIDIDSVTNPKVIGSSLVRLNDANERITANYEFAANGEVILQANADQQVHIVSAHYGSNNEWISEPWVTWSVQTFKNQRYLSMRGSR